MRQYIIVRQDLKMSKGKIANQCCHASIGAARNLPNHMIETWFTKHKQTKIILKINSLKDLVELEYELQKLGLKPYLVKNLTKDKWMNHLTCIGVGPYDDKKLEKLVKELKLL